MSFRDGAGQRLFLLSVGDAAGLDIFFPEAQIQPLIIRFSVAVNIDIELDLALLALGPGVGRYVPDAVLVPEQVADGLHDGWDLTRKGHWHVGSACQPGESLKLVLGLQYRHSRRCRKIITILLEVQIPNSNSKDRDPRARDNLHRFVEGDLAESINAGCN